MLVQNGPEKEGCFTLQRIRAPWADRESLQKFSHFRGSLDKEERVNNLQRDYLSSIQALTFLEVYWAFKCLYALGKKSQAGLHSPG